MSSDPGSPAPASHRSDRLVTVGIAVIAAAQLITAALILITPHWFFENIGTFGVFNGHYLGDAGTMTLGAGLGLLASLKYTALRVGAIGTNLAIISAHAVNHWFDVGNAHPGSNAGISAAVSLTLLVAATAYLLRAATRTAPA